MSRKSSAGHTGGRGIVLDVSQEIINAAIPKDSSHCIIADALRAAVPAARHVSVDLQTIRFTDPATSKRYVFLTPGPAQSVLVNFDQGVMPEPFLMRLGKPAQIVKSGRTARDKGETDAHPNMPPGQRRRLRTRTDATQGHPQVLGGKLPPTAALSSTRGKRRTFGLRTLRP